MTTKKTTIELEPEEIDLLLSALDSHQYWQLAEEHERSNGDVILPEDRELFGAGPIEDPDQGDDEEEDKDDEDEDDDENHEEIRQCRRLEAKLQALRPKEPALP